MSQQNEGLMDYYYGDNLMENPLFFGQIQTDCLPVKYETIKELPNEFHYSKEGFRKWT